MLRRPANLCLALGVLTLAGTACKREDPEIVALTRRATQAEEASRELRQAWRAQYHRLKLLAVRPLPPEQLPLALSPEQKGLLEARLKAERDISRRALIRETLEKDKDIQALSQLLSQLRSELPAPELVRRNESHYGLALRFLRQQGCSATEAKAILSRADLLDRIAPGFEVYHFFRKGTYSAWVAQGSAPFSPRDLAQPDWELLQNQRDERREGNDQLRRELQHLKGQHLATEQEVHALRAEQRQLAEGAATLQQDNAHQLARLNSLHYLVGVREALRASGVIETPLLDKDRSGPAWRDALFTRSLDLREGRVLQFRARDYGLKRIGRVVLVPGSYLPNEHYRLTLSPDGQMATLELMSPERFRNDKVVFALID